MGFTKDEATAAIRQITKGAERGALLTFLGSLNEQVLQLQLVSLEDDSAAIVACVQILQKQQGDHESSCLFSLLHTEIIASMPMGLSKSCFSIQSCYQTSQCILIHSICYVLFSLF